MFETIRMKKALIFTTGQGHESIALVVQKTLQDAGWEVKVEKYSQELKIHVFLHQHSASLMRFLSQIFLVSWIIPFEKYILKHFFQKYVFRLIESYKPNLVISTFYALNPSIEQGKKLFSYGFLNLITDPRNFLPLNPSIEADINTVFDSFQKKTVKKMNPSLQVEELGWLVKQECEREDSKESARKKLNLPANTLTFLLSSGSLGNEESSRFISFFLRQKTPLQVILIAGKNESLFQKIEALQKNNNNPQVKLLVLAYQKNIPDYMRAADVVMGKAGPNTLFESVAVGTPFFVTNYGGIQESGNIEIIQEYNLGFTPKNTEEAENILTQIIDNPLSLKIFQNHLLKMKKKNQLAKEKLVEMVERISSFFQKDNT